MNSIVRHFGDIEVNGVSFNNDLSDQNQEAKVVIIAISTTSYQVVKKSSTSQQTTVTTALSAFTTAFGYLTAGRTWIEKISCYGSFDLSVAASAVSVPSYTEIETFGRYLLPTAPALNRCIFDINTVTNVVVRGGRFTNTAYTNGETAGEYGAVINIYSSTLVAVVDVFISGYSGQGINIRQASDQVLLQRCNIEKIACRGIWVIFSSNVTVSDNIVRLTGRGPTLFDQGDGVDVDGYSSKVIVTNNQFTTTGRNGIHVEEASNEVVVSGNRVTSATYEAIKLECVATPDSTTNLIVTGNVLISSSFGMTIQATGSGGGKLRYVIVSNNLASGNTNVGYYIGTNTEHVTIQNNIARGNATGFSIPNVGGRINTNIVNNVSTANNTTDYNIGSASGTYISGNLDSGSGNVSKLRDDLKVPSLQVTGGAGIAGNSYVGSSCVCGSHKSPYVINMYWYLTSNTASSNMSSIVTLPSSSWTLLSHSSVTNSSGATIMDTNGMLTIPIKGVYTVRIQGHFAGFSSGTTNAVWFDPGTGQGHLSLSGGRRFCTHEAKDAGILTTSYTALFQQGDTLYPRFYSSGTNNLVTATSTISGTNLSLTLIQIVP